MITEGLLLMLLLLFWDNVSQLNGTDGYMTV